MAILQNWTIQEWLVAVGAISAFVSVFVAIYFGAIHRVRNRRPNEVIKQQAGDHGFNVGGSVNGDINISDSTRKPQND